MSLNGIQAGRTYQVRDIKPDIDLEELSRAGENDDLVNIVVNAPKLDGGAPERLQMISGEKIDLKELGRANPDLAIREIRNYDADGNGILEETDLQVSFWDVFSEAPFWTVALGGFSGAIGYATEVAEGGDIIGVEYLKKEHQSPSGQVISLR